MKNLSNLLIAAIVIVCCFETACNKQDDSLIPNSSNSGILKSAADKSGLVFIVSPGADLKDSKAIQKAFDDAVAAGPGSTVQLTKGTFCLDERIEVEGFVGCFKGAGKDKTVITTPIDKPVDFSLPVADWESLIKFRHGNINISDFTIKISNPHPCAGITDNWTDGFPTIFLFTGNSVKDGVLTNQFGSATLNNVKFIGWRYDVFDESGEAYNIAYAVSWGGDGYDPLNWHNFKGNFKFTNCEFKTIGWCIQAIGDGNCIIGGDNNSGNKFEDALYGVCSDDCSNSTFDISNNCFTKVFILPVQLAQGAFGSPVSLSKFLIRKNYIEVLYGDAIELDDDSNGQGEEKKLDVNISDNKIYLSKSEYGDIGGWTGGINGKRAKDVLVTNNTIWGNTLFGGIYAGTGDYESSGWLIKGNNVQGVNAQVAPIWLGPKTSNFTVIGSSLNTTVLDEGTNNNLINVSKKHWDHAPKEIHDKMMRSHEMMKPFRGHRR